MKNYTVERIGNGWLVKETQTEQYICSFKKGDLARQMCGRLNSGNGFAGWTPAFMLQEGINFTNASKNV